MWLSNLLYYVLFCQENASELGSFERLLSELVEHQNWLLCTEMTLCNQHCLCVASNDMAGKISSSQTELQVWIELVLCANLANLVQLHVLK